MGSFFNRFLMNAKKLVPGTGPVRNRPLEQARRDYNKEAPARAEAKVIAETKEAAKQARLDTKARKDAEAAAEVTAEAKAKAIEETENERAALIEREQARGV